MKKLYMFWLILFIPGVVYAKLPDWLNIETGTKAWGDFNLWSEPENGADQIGFGLRTVGWGAGGGVYVQARFIKYIGLDIEVLIGHDRIIEDDTIYGAHVKFIPKMNSVKIPLLIKGVLPLLGVRLSLGTGPIFEIPFSSSFEVKSDYVRILSKTGIKTKTSVLWGMQFGINIRIYKNLRFPIDFRAAYNLSQPKKYRDRVKLETNGSVINSLKITYQNTWEFSALGGLGYEF